MADNQKAQREWAADEWVDIFHHLNTHSLSGNAHRLSSRFLVPTAT